MHTLIRHTHLFNAYIAIDPSLWWDNQALLKQASKALGEKRFAHRSLFVAMANNIPPGMDTISVLKNTSTMTAVTRAIIPFIKTLRDNPGNGLRWTSKFYPNERHGTVELIAKYDALRYLFNYYAFSPTMLSWLHPGGWDEDSMGDYYLVAGNKAGAIASFTKSLQLQETADTRKKLTALTAPGR